MPSGSLTNQKGLQTSTELFVKNITRVFHTGDRPLPFVGAFSVHGSGFFERGLMAACNHLLGKPQLRAVRQLHGSVINGVERRFGVSSRSDSSFGYNRIMGYCKTGNLRANNLLGSNIICRNFWNDASGKTWKSGSGSNKKPGIQGSQSSYSAACISTGAASEVSFDGTSEQSGNSAVSSDKKQETSSSLKLLSGSSYLPHPDKESTGGEDAHFICTDEHVIGVADGVGGWADLGVNAGHYARELMSNSVSAIKQEPKGSVDPSRVLERAYTSTKSRGSSTACIIALTDKGVHAVNLGDSGFIVVREGCTIFRSPVQQHDFNFTYQLESGNGSDLPSSAQVFNFPVEAGDVIIAGTDGLFDNLYDNEVTAVVVHAVRAGLGPQVTAQKIAALARQRALDKNRQTPFSSAAQEAGYRYYGGKLDDITVVVSYITA
ncbi:hypothetical protein LUZ60_010529 [Juncus effusus]|nr:hypothetical protein LUZ60_010529 [Juncus effusus]